MKSISIIGNPLGKVRRDVIRVRKSARSDTDWEKPSCRFQLGTEAILKYLANRLTVDDGTQGGAHKAFDIPKAAETEDERKRRLYTEHHVVRSTGTFDFSHKNASSLSEESIELITREKPSHVNLSKNKFTEMPLA